jgi:hypothetical protein
VYQVTRNDLLFHQYNKRLLHYAFKNKQKIEIELEINRKFKNILPIKEIVQIFQLSILIKVDY